MSKLNLETFLNFVKDPASNTEGFEKWGLYPNEEPTNPTSGSKSFTNKKNPKEDAPTGKYNY